MMESAFAQGRYQVKKRITQQRELYVIFGLMPAFVFIKFFQKRNADEKQNVKKVARGKRFLT